MLALKGTCLTIEANHPLLHSFCCGSIYYQQRIARATRCLASSPLHAGGLPRIGGYGTGSGARTISRRCSGSLRLQWKMNTNIVPYESNHRGNAHQLSKIPETTDCLSRPSLVELLSHGEQNVPNEIYFATISPAEEVRDDQTNPSLIGRAFSRNSQLRCSVVLIVDGIMFLLLMISIIVLGLPTGSYLFRPRYAASVICAGAGLGMVLIATGCVGICAALTRKTVHAEICAALSLISSGSLFISFIIVVTMFHRLTDKHWAGSGVDFAVLTVSIIIFIVGITTGIIQTMVQFRILMCFSKKKVDVTTGDIDHTTAPVLLISDDEMQLAITQKGEGNKD